MRAVQHIRHRMNGMEHQTFGLPGEVPSAVTTYIVKGEMLTVGASKSGALAGFTFSDEDHQAWMADPVFRFLDQALSRPEPDRTMLQGRALLAISLLSELPRVFRTGNSRLFHAASCPFRYSSRTSCGVRYPSVEWRRVLL